MVYYIRFFCTRTVFWCRRERKGTMTSATICILIAIVVYLVLMLYIGVRLQRKTTTPTTFIWVAENSARWSQP